MNLKIKVHAAGLLNYISAGKITVQRARKAMGKVLNVGRKEARQRISADFGVRTGFLRRQARKMQTKTTIRASEIKGEVKPIPRLMNIFEGGATLSNGRGILPARPVVWPGQKAMDAVAFAEFNKVLSEVGK